MKIRNDFVTNSSSSSFVLAFKDMDELSDFKDRCEWMNYRPFLKLINSIMNESGSCDKDKAKEKLENYYRAKGRVAVLDENVKLDDYETSYDHYKACCEFEKSEGFEELVDEWVANSDYEKRLKWIDDSAIVVNGMIWDTGGGILEWAIRHGFIEREFGRNTVLVRNIG